MRRILLLAFVSIPLLAAADSAAAPQFERDIVPIFTEHCYKCHGLEGRMAGLDLRTPPLVLQGGDSGPAVVKGLAEQSLLFKKISSNSMPPGERKLGKENIETI